MKQKLLFLVFMLFSTLISVAEDNSVKLIILQSDGNLISFNLDERPVSTLTTGNLVITTQTSNFSYPLSRIKKFYYENVTEGIDKVNIDEINITQKDDLIIIHKLTKGKTVSIYSLDGRLMISKISTGVSPIVISIENLPGGTYVVKADYATFKTLKR